MGYKTHFGFICGDGYEEWIQDDKTLCGCTGEEVLENYTTSNWKDVTCKKCLKLKDRVIEGQKEDEKHIIKQMGDMAKFWEEERLNEIHNK